MKRALLKLFGLAALGGCTSARGEGKSVGTVSFNYTNRYIGDVTVNGAWTGGVDAFGGGGKIAQGLIAPKDLNKKLVLKIRWSVGSYYSIENNTYDRAPIEPHFAEVEIIGPHPSNPSYLVLHFYPDGHVEAELEADRPKRRIPPPSGYHR